MSHAENLNIIILEDKNIEKRCRLNNSHVADLSMTHYLVFVSMLSNQYVKEGYLMCKWSTMRGRLPTRFKHWRDMIQQKGTRLCHSK
jgi:hypothetical protein